MSEPTIDTGTEWLVDASECNRERLRDLETLRTLFANIVRDLGLRPAAEPVWKVFGGEGGITGMVLLTESHLTIHTFPEHGHAAINLYCCTPRDEWDWQRGLAASIDARRVRVRKLARAGAIPAGEKGT